MAAIVTSERAASITQAWWEILPGALPRDVHYFFEFGIAATPEPPIARKQIIGCVPFVWYVLRSYARGYWQVIAPEGGRWPLCVDAIRGTRYRKFQTRASAMVAVDTEIRRREKSR